MIINQKTTVEEFARLKALLCQEERVEARNHSHLCRCPKCQKLNFFLVIRECIEQWEGFREGDRSVRQEYDLFWEALARMNQEREEILCVAAT